MTQCGAKNRKGGACAQPAGWGTDHVGFGRCKLHGGATPIVTGRYSIKRQELAAKAQAFANDTKPGDLTGELTLMRALLQDYMDRFDDNSRLPFDDIERIFSMIEAIGRLVERIAKILNTTALTQAEVKYLQTRIAELLTTYVPDADKREQFMVELAAAIGGGGGYQATRYIETEAD